MTLSAREFADLFQYTYDTDRSLKVGPNTHDLTVTWAVEILGMDIRATQIFDAPPYLFRVSSYVDDALRWCANLEMVRARTHSFVEKVVLFGKLWSPVDLPSLIEGDPDLYENDVFLLRMSKELWTPVPF